MNLRVGSLSIGRGWDSGASIIISIAWGSGSGSWAVMLFGKGSCSDMDVMLSSSIIGSGSGCRSAIDGSWPASHY